MQVFKHKKAAAVASSAAAALWKAPPFPRTVSILLVTALPVISLYPIGQSRAWSTPAMRT